MSEKMSDKRTFYTIQICYKIVAIDVLDQDGGFKTRRIVNNTAAALKALREDIFITGLYVPVDTDTGYIVPPANITHIEVYRQQRFFKPHESNYTLVNDGR